jgi:hypothetical protein
MSQKIKFSKKQRNEILKKIQEQQSQQLNSIVGQVLEQILKRKPGVNDFKDVVLLSVKGAKYPGYGVKYKGVPIGSILIKEDGLLFSPNKYFSGQNNQNQ